ncbi:MAG: hypothetical protein QXU97_03445 [Fervidicoccaceae archaeon]
MEESLLLGLWNLEVYERLVLRGASDEVSRSPRPGFGVMYFSANGKVVWLRGSEPTSLWYRTSRPQRLSPWRLGLHEHECGEDGAMPLSTIPWEASIVRGIDIEEKVVTILEVEGYGSLDELSHKRYEKLRPVNAERVTEGARINLGVGWASIQLSGGSLELEAGGEPEALAGPRLSALVWPNVAMIIDRAGGLLLLLPLKGRLSFTMGAKVDQPLVFWLQPFALVWDSLSVGEKLVSGLVGLRGPEGAIAVVSSSELEARFIGRELEASSERPVAVYSGRGLSRDLVRRWYELSAKFGRARELTPLVKLSPPALIPHSSRLRCVGERGPHELELELVNPMPRSVSTRIYVRPPHYVAKASAAIDGEEELAPARPNSLELALPPYEAISLKLELRSTAGLYSKPSNW